MARIKVFMFFFFATVSTAAGATNLLLPNQSRLENPAMTYAEYSVIGEASLQVNAEGPVKRGYCLQIQPASGKPGNSYGVSTTAGIRQRVYWYEKKETGEETSTFLPGVYTFSLCARGSGSVNLGFFPDKGDKANKNFEISQDWRRFAVTLRLEQAAATISLLATSSSPGGFCIAQVQLEQGDKPNKFNAPPVPTQRSAVHGKDFLFKKGDRIVCLGDSMTDWNPGYVSVMRQRVDKKYPERQITIIQAGVGGNFFSALRSRVLKDVVAREPNWVLVNGGLNDVGHKVPLEESRNSLESLIKTIQESTPAEIVLIETTPFAGRPDLDEGVRVINKMVRDVARKNRLMVVPLEEAIAKAKEKARETGETIYFSDPHFNLHGFTIMADTILKTLNY